VPVPSTSCFYLPVGKRIFDFAASALAVLLLAPVFVLLAAAVFLTSGSPVFFRQERTGRKGRPFRIWKFRTMHSTGPDDPAGPLITAAGDARITSIGKWLRRCKADELPQLFNVLVGEMSLVGPRPEVPRYTNTYSPAQRLILDVRPGITGPASNDFIAEEELLCNAADKEAFYLSVLLPAKLAKDLKYVQEMSFNTDLKHIANTFSGLLFQSRQTQNLSRSPQRARNVNEKHAVR
jgi:lipopolysaccharide/colanic/teichoic acid biosynthesis glycosyltransferase